MLKDQIASDMSIFFNLNEFGEKHTINGEEKTVIVDNEELESLKAKGTESVHKLQILFFIPADSLPGKPKPEGPMKFDNKSYKVTSCIEDAGMFKIILGAYRS